MNGLLTLIRKQLIEARWMLGLSILALFALGWLVAMDTGRFLNDANRQKQFRAFAADLPLSLVLQRELFFWNLPPVLLPVLIWAIARGSLSVAGELERGTLDLVLARPVRRSVYLAAHVAVGIAGLMLIVGALAGGAMFGNWLHKVPNPPTFLIWARPWSNLVALGLAIFGYTLLASTYDIFRWRATMTGSVLTILAVILLAIANFEVLARYRKAIEAASIFKRYHPSSAALTGKGLGFNLGVLGMIAAACILLGFAIFCRRDLPASGG